MDFCHEPPNLAYFVLNPKETKKSLWTKIIIPVEKNVMRPGLAHQLWWASNRIT